MRTSGILKEMTEVPICWGYALLAICKKGELMKYLNILPRSRWIEKDPEDGSTFLHYAACGSNNIDATVALIKAGINVDALRSLCSHSALHIAALNEKIRICEVLIACGANMRIRNAYFSIPFGYTPSRECQKIFIANGLRLKSEFHDPTLFILYPFEQGVLKCRQAVISIIRIFQMGKIRIGCKYMIRELGAALWATRKDEIWQKN